MNPRNSWPAVVIAAAAMMAGGGMAIAGVEKDTIILVLGVLATPVISALVAAQGAQTATKVEAVQQQTNGHQSAMLSVIEAQSRLLAAGSPAAGGDQAAADHPPAPGSPTWPPATT